MRHFIARLSQIRQVHVLALAICLASLGLLVTPGDASAAAGDRSCACNNTTVCGEEYAYYRFCCEFPSGGGSPTCGCTLYITNCIEDQ